MAQRSVHIVTNVYYRNTSCFATVFGQTVLACSAKVSRTNVPSCTMWFRQFTKNITKTDHKDRSHPHSIEHDTQPIAYLISKQVIPYRTRGDTCCPGVSTPKIQSLADSSMIADCLVKIRVLQKGTKRHQGTKIEENQERSRSHKN
jgi:hypothetical protein